jgi:hypothetical protein
MLPRFGHSCELWRGSVLVVYGGASNYIPSLSYRDLPGGLYFFDIAEGSWSVVTPRGFVVAPRRYHSATIIGRHMLIFGGLDACNQLLDDILAYRFDKQSWERVE